MKVYVLLELYEEFDDILCVCATKQQAIEKMHEIEQKEKAQRGYYRCMRIEETNFYN